MTLLKWLLYVYLFFFLIKFPFLMHLSRTLLSFYSVFMGTANKLILLFFSSFDFKCRISVSCRVYVVIFFSGYSRTKRPNVASSFFLYRPREDDELVTS